jgi:methyl-accepting chemotaxis protein
MCNEIDVVMTIKSLSDQTNLLALNTAIESTMSATISDSANHYPT